MKIGEIITLVIHRHHHCLQFLCLKLFNLLHKMETFKHKKTLLSIVIAVETGTPEKLVKIGTRLPKSGMWSEVFGILSVTFKRKIRNDSSTTTPICT